MSSFYCLLFLIYYSLFIVYHFRFIVVVFFVILLIVYLLLFRSICFIFVLFSVINNCLLSVLLFLNISLYCFFLLFVGRYCLLFRNYLLFFKPSYIILLKFEKSASIIQFIARKPCMFGRLTNKDKRFMQMQLHFIFLLCSNIFSYRRKHYSSL